MFVQEAFPAIIPKTHGRTPRFLQQFLFNIFQNANTIKKTTQIHTQIIINDFTQRNFIIVKLLQSYVSSGYLHQAHRVFEQINNPSTTSWNQIIRGYASSDTPRESIHLFDEMLESGEIPDEYSYCYVINACARGKLLRLGEKFHGRVLAGGFCSNLFVQTNLVNLYVVGEGDYGGMKNARKVFDEMTERNVVTWNTLLSGYVKCCDIDGARRVFDEMPERNIVSWTTLVSGCAHNGGCKEALSLLRKMLHARMEFDHAILVAALSACAEIGDLKMGRWIHSYIHRSLHLKNEEHTVRLNNTLLHMYAGCGLIDDAYELFKRMPVKTTVSWTTMISSFAKQGRGKDALSVFQSMENAKDVSPKPDAVTILVVLNACSHSGFVEQGRRIFKNMNLIWGINPKIEHYGCMVDLLSRAGLLDEALTLLESMPMNPNDAIWGALLGGCRIHKNVKLASLIAQKLANLNLEDDKVAGYLVLLSNIYAGAKKWKDVANAREKMVQLEVRKAPGRSWVQIGGSVHEFLAGDRTHKCASLIYKMLVLVTIEAGLSGYEPDVYMHNLMFFNRFPNSHRSQSSGNMVSSVDRSEIAFFDLETTVPTRPGQGFAILEFGSILVCPRKLVELESYETLVRPHNLSLISTLSVRANGITADSVVSAPTFSEIADRVYDILHGRIWAGHNIIRFDCVRLREAFAQINRPPPEPKGTIDSLALLTQRFGRRAGDMKMASLAAYFGLGKQTHRSLDDVRMNLEVLKYCATVLFLESSLPDIFTENSWVSPNATTRNRSNAKAALNGTSLTTSPPSSSRDIENQSSPPNEGIHPIFSLAASGAGEQVPNPVESGNPQSDPFDLGPLVDKIENEIFQSNEAMEEESSTATASNAISESSEFIEPDEVSMPSVTVAAVPFFRGPQKMQILHRDVPLQMRSNSLRVRFGFSTKYVDLAGRPRLSIVVDAPPNLCGILDACDDLANKRFVEADSDSEWRPVVSRKPGFYNFPTIRLQLPNVVEGDSARLITEIYQKESSSSIRPVVFSRYDVAELQALIHPGSIVDAYFSLDPYDYQQNAGIRLVAKKLVVASN